MFKAVFIQSVYNLAGLIYIDDRLYALYYGVTLFMHWDFECH